MKSRIIATIFAWFFGTFGINNFYTGNKVKGIIDLAAIFGPALLALPFAVITQNFETVPLFWVGLSCFCAVIVTIVNYVRGFMYLWCDTDTEFNDKFVINNKSKKILTD